MAASQVGSVELQGQVEQQVWELDPSLFVLGKAIGSGSYATVYLAQMVNPALGNIATR